MAIEYSVASEDFVLANRRHCGLIYRSWRGWIMPIFAGVIWSTVIVLDLDLPWAQVAAAFLIMTLIFAGVLWLLMIGINALLMPRRARKLHRQTRSLHMPFALDWDESEMRLESERGNQRVPWSDFVKWTQGDDGLMLYASDAMFYMLPSRDVPEAAQDAIKRHLVAHNVPEWRAWRRLGKRTG